MSYTLYITALHHIASLYLLAYELANMKYIIFDSSKSDREMHLVRKSDKMKGVGGRKGSNHFEVPFTAVFDPEATFETAAFAPEFC